jgi:hypothetical protein
MGCAEYKTLLYNSLLVDSCQRPPSFCPPPVFSLMNKKIPEKLLTQRGEFEARRPSHQDRTSTAGLPGNVISFILPSLAPPIRRGLRGAFGSEPLECGHDWMLLCLGLWESGFSETGFILARDRGGSLKRLHRPNCFKLWLHGFQGEKPGPKVFTGVDAVCPKCGPYEASERIYPGYGQGKNWGWASHLRLETFMIQAGYIMNS